MDFPNASRGEAMRQEEWMMPLTCTEAVIT